MRAILARKIEMSHIFDEAGKFVPVTLLLAEGNVVTQLKTTASDGYDALQIGFGTSKKVSKPLEGHLKNSGVKTRTLKEVEAEDGKEYKVGDNISVEIFEEGDVVDVQGVSKGKGFAGTIKRHNFHRGPKTHGSHNYRAPGSICAMYPQHVFKGKKLPGRMGGVTVKDKNLKIAKVMPEENLILIRGSVPGPKKGIVLLIAKDKVNKSEGGEE
jgi:large subunit ribosomal protein L3